MNNVVVKRVSSIDEDVVYLNDFTTPEELVAQLESVPLADTMPGKGSRIVVEFNKENGEKVSVTLADATSNRDFDHYRFTIHSVAFIESVRDGKNYTQEYDALCSEYRVNDKAVPSQEDFIWERRQS